MSFVLKTFWLVTRWCFYSWRAVDCDFESDDEGRLGGGWGTAGKKTTEKTVGVKPSRTDSFQEKHMESCVQKKTPDLGGSDIKHCVEVNDEGVSTTESHYGASNRGQKRN